jgi:hydrophobe/amphiphile efflux-1 (HAE1) family protein
VSLSSPFIQRPVATVLLTAAVALAGGVAYSQLPVAPLPQIDFPAISVQASLPGASPETMASSVATPLERQFSRIAGVTEMTSTSYLGSTSVTLLFDLGRNIDGAARDVEAAINAARGYLPTNLPSNPTYRKVNPADSPILILALTSKVYDRGRLYDLASTILSQRLSQIQGVGQVVVGGSSLPAVRVELNPTQLNAYGIGLEDVRTLLAAQNVLSPKGQLESGATTTDLAANDQMFRAKDYAPLIVRYSGGTAVKLSDVATVQDSVQDVRTAGNMNGEPAVLVIIFRQPGANIIDTVDRIRAAFPDLAGWIPSGIKSTVVLDQTTTIRASVRDVERTLIASILLVIVVVFVFLRNGRATLIPSVAVPVSLIGTFAVMFLCHYTLDNLSLMALTIATGFVVDDAIVVSENVVRHLEQGMTPMEAALKGAREIGFTVLSISVSLVAVFTPILLMGGIVGRLLREFAVTLSVAIVVSLLVSLTTTPMMGARLLRHESQEGHGRLYRMSEQAFSLLSRAYQGSLAAVLRHPGATLGVLLLTVAASVYLFAIVPKGFFPQQDTGRLNGAIQAEQDTSFQAMEGRLKHFVDIIKSDPAVATVMAFTGGGGGSTTNTGRVFVSLKPLEERDATADQIISRLRPKLARVTGATLYMQASQDVRVSGVQSNAQYIYAIQSENLSDLQRYGPILLREMRKRPELTDVSSDQQDRGLQSEIVYDRATAARLGLTPLLIDNVLYDAFGQRLVSKMYTQLNQYYVVMEVEPRFWQSPAALDLIFLEPTSGGQVPLSAVAHYAPTTAPIAVNHRGLFPSVTVSFNLAPGVALSQATAAIDEVQRQIGMPATIHGSLAGTLQAFQASLATEPLLIAMALAAVYIVLGILYESYVHPITILSTLPSAGLGAVLALLICGMDLNVIALVGIILLIGIVKKNAIMMIDFALAAERLEGKSPAQSIEEACRLRFRPILMTTAAALLGAVPLALGTGTGSELRRPLGVTIIGGLVVSQLLTLYTTPVVYLSLDRLRLRLERWRQGRALAEPTP